MEASEVIPVLRIFDYKKTIEFYVDWLGFKIDWEHRFHDDAPIYLQVSNGNMVLHLTEHHGDCSPGAKVFINCSGLKEFHKGLKKKNYKYNNPGISKAPWKDLCMEVTDPFHNKLIFNEKRN
ncbi:glyoxalase superfamily protein [Ekhidna sp.]|uniref:glyoxalase superfamily protein n=1 Tax=Ekhidna sp. TaxID=2608089 RepID=UPI003CCC3947